MNTLASVEEIYLSYRKKEWALENVSINFSEGSVTAVVGANGSGKSTLLKSLAGLIRVSKGQVRAGNSTPHDLTSDFRQFMGYADQYTLLDGEISGRETLNLFAALYGMDTKQRKARIETLLEIFGLNPHVNKLVKKYSGGLKQRLHLAVSALHAPKLWLLDEPTSALDPQGRSEFWAYAKNIVQDGTCVVMATHDLDQVQNFADQVCILDAGKLVKYDSPEAIIKQQRSILWTMETSGSADRSSFLTEVGNIEGVTRVEGKDNRIWVSALEGSLDEARIQALTQQHNLVILELKKRLPDLHTAYFELTGRSIENTAPKTGKKR